MENKKSNNIAVCIICSILTAYVLRYKAHREAGLADAAETK